MTFWQYFACLFCGSVGVFYALLFGCRCVLARWADEARWQTQGDG